MNVRARKDNVIYANFGGKTRVDTPPPAPKRRQVAESYQQGFIRDIYRAGTDEGRISRGMSYARNGNVVAFDVQRERVVASVAGSQNEPFEVGIIFPRRSSDDIQELTSELLDTPGALAAIRQGRLTASMATILLADSPSEVRTLCDCPDSARCCKHVVAVLEEFAEKVGSDPTLLFQLRALNFAQLERTMVEQARSRSSETASNPERFWEGGKLPSLPTPKIAPAIDDADSDVLHKAMRSVSYTAVEELRAVSDLEELYDFLVQRD